MIAGLLQRRGHPADGGVVGFSTAAGEHYFSGPAMQHLRHPLPGAVQRVTGFLPNRVHAGWIPVQSREIGKHGFQHPGVGRGGSRMVQIHDFLRRHLCPLLLFQPPFPGGNPDYRAAGSIVAQAAERRLLNTVPVPPPGEPYDTVSAYEAQQFTVSHHRQTT